MTYLIDGYNLLHAMGVLHGRTGPTGLQKARLALLGLLHAGFGNETPSVTVVFDAAHAPPGAQGEEDFHGVRVRFAIHEAEADDLIEFLIRHDSAPRHLTVVSDDHRLQKEARRRRCIVSGCAEFLDWLDKHRHKRRKPSGEEPAKPEIVSPREAENWLREFGDLDKDTRFKNK
jgi:predicted RNA-binding protein with PIN domain